MKYILTILLLTLFTLTLKAQKHAYRTDLDTIQVYPEKTFVHYKTYQDSLLFEDAEAFLYPTTLEIPRFRYLRTIFKTKIPADSIVFQGAKTNYLSNRYFKTEIYDNGKLLSTNFFDSTGHNISVKEYHAKNNIKGPCVKLSGYYFLHGTKEVKN